MKTHQNYSIQFLIRTSKARNGKSPIYCRINVNGKRSEISLKKYIESSKWISTAGIVKGNSEEARVINTQINQLKVEINQHFNQLVSSNRTISAELIKNTLCGVGVQEKTLIEVFKYHNQQMKERIGTDVVKATHCKFETVLGKLETFLKKKYQRTDFNLDELNHKFIIDFEHYLKTVENIGHNTTMKYVRNMKKIMNMAVSNEWISKNPFGQFKCSSNKVVREILTDLEINELSVKKFDIIRLDEVRDIFLFCCYTGYAFVDVEKLTANDVSIGIDGGKWIFTRREKTKTVANVPLLPLAQRILDKYNNHEYCMNTGKLLPVKSNQKMNAYLKEVASLCGINKTLTMHMARHTFATTITLSNGVPIETVSKMLGHTKLATTQIYAQVLEQKVSEDMQKLKEKLTNKLIPHTGT
jgi:site-specific recombinase XerD